MTKLSKKKIIILGMLVALFLFYWTFLPCPFLSTAPDNINMPAYITQVWPPADSKTGIGCYYVTSIWWLPAPRGVGVAISVGEVLHWGTSYEYEHGKPFEERVMLYVDGKLISDSDAKRLVLQSGEMVDKNLIPSELATVYEISWVPRLSFGKHVARVVIIAPFKKTLDYEWHFTIR